MKTKGILIALTLVIYTSFNLFASAMPVITGSMDNDPTYKWINIRVNKDNLVVLRACSFEGEKRVNLELKVYSENRELVFDSRIFKKGEVYTKFDLSKLPEGKYTFEVHKKQKNIYTKEVFKTNELVSTDEGITRMVVQEL